VEGPMAREGSEPNVWYFVEEVKRLAVEEARGGFVAARDGLAEVRVEVEATGMGGGREGSVEAEIEVEVVSFLNVVLRNLDAAFPLGLAACKVRSE
jgi:hypothetical protein